MTFRWGVLMLLAVMALESGCAGIQRRKQEKITAQRAIQTAEQEIASAKETQGSYSSDAIISAAMGSTESSMRRAKEKFAAKDYAGSHGSADYARSQAQSAKRLVEDARQAELEAKRKAAEERLSAEQAAKKKKPSKPKKKGH